MAGAGDEKGRRKGGEVRCGNGGDGVGQSPGWNVTPCLGGEEELSRGTGLEGETSMGEVDGLGSDGDEETAKAERPAAWAPGECL